ncbi:MAG TPA: hypothetical protein VEQ37_00945 [Actinomycetota bacterium]|nr:hypothetical protein [Actinomycetota bacterium]
MHLAQSPVVAKVGTSHFRDAKQESLERELAVATHLAERDAPSVRPAEPLGRHVAVDVLALVLRAVDARPLVPSG